MWLQQGFGAPESHRGFLSRCTSGVSSRFNLQITPLGSQRLIVVQVIPRTGYYANMEQAASLTFATIAFIFSFLFYTMSAGFKSFSERLKTATARSLIAVSCHHSQHMQRELCRLVCGQMIDYSDVYRK